MLKKIAINNQETPSQTNSPIVIRKSSYSSANKTSIFEPQANPRNLPGFPIRSNYRNMPETQRNQPLLTHREASIDQIKSKLKQYLRKTQQTSLLNYQNESLPEFARKSIHQNFRMTIFRNNLKRKINLKILEAPFADRYESSPEFNVSEALINPRAKQKLEDSEKNDKLFHPKREYFIHQHQKKKQKIPIPRLLPPKTVYPLTKREQSYRQRQRGGIDVQPWRRWGRDSEEGDLNGQDL